MGAPTANDWNTFNSIGNKEKMQVIRCYLVDGYNMKQTAAKVFGSETNDRTVSCVTRCYGFEDRNSGVICKYMEAPSDKVLMEFVKKHPSGCYYDGLGSEMIEWLKKYSGAGTDRAVSGASKNSTDDIVNKRVDRSANKRISSATNKERGSKFKEWVYYYLSVSLFDFSDKQLQQELGVGKLGYKLILGGEKYIHFFTIIMAVFIAISTPSGTFGKALFFFVVAWSVQAAIRRWLHKTSIVGTLKSFLFTIYLIVMFLLELILAMFFYFL